MNGKAIRALRRRNKWTQAELAARLGTDAVTVSRWERGVSTPRPSATMRLSELASSIPRSLHSLIRAVGVAEAQRILRRALLLVHKPSRQRFAADPTERLREVELALIQQRELKARVRLPQ